MKTFFKKTKFMYAGMGMAALLLTSNVALAAANCSKLVGTWQITYKDDISTYADAFAIKNVGGNGTISGTDAYGGPMHGYCKNGVVVLGADNFAQLSDGLYFLDGYHFVNGSPRFARYTAAFDTTDTIGTFWADASIKKISNSTNSATQGKRAIASTGSDYKKRQALERMHRQHQSRQ
ncbi:exported hypothetical protein [Crenothrix polyspora]|uniref:Lipocalin-like domain-containing protein n=1 Tax=Crenothrix polyspora TaxID=360316 RepID=A0A1R4H356_9GAMM|nr:hypothetical protein [Crenothrix polyspora]SJM90688.1 exported hypothetical protein [Crenothrix polyspora]